MPFKHIISSHFFAFTIIFNRPPASFNKGDAPIHFREVEEIVKTNYLGLKTITEAFIPFMAQGSRIINISSHFAQFKAFNATDENSVKELMDVATTGSPEAKYSKNFIGNIDSVYLLLRKGSQPHAKPEQ